LGGDLDDRGLLDAILRGSHCCLPPVEMVIGQVGVWG
jgi:hypothetical protein